MKSNLKLNMDKLFKHTERQVRLQEMLGPGDVQGQAKYSRCGTAQTTTNGRKVTQFDKKL
jgi:hypothetical protein